MPRKRLPDLPGINKLSHEYKQFLAYLHGSDAEQYDIVRDRWAKLNWALLDKCEQAVDALQKGESPAKISPLIISAGIGFDKLYSKRSEQSKPLSFPPPLLDMVRKGLRLQSSVPARGESEALPEVSESKPFGERSADNKHSVNSQDGASGSKQSSEEVVGGSVTGGVACADPEAVKRGQGPTLSRQAQRLPDISQNQKKRVRPTRTPEQRAKVVARDKALRHEKKATRAAMLAALRETIRAEIPYRHPPTRGGVV